MEVRAKNYSAQENKLLLQMCNRYHNVINKNSIKTSDKVKKEKAWQSISQQFHDRLQKDGELVKKFIFFHFDCCAIDLIFIYKGATTLN